MILNKLENLEKSSLVQMVTIVTQKSSNYKLASCMIAIFATFLISLLLVINDYFSAHQGVEDDDMNLICLGGRVTGFAAAQEYITAFLNATFTGAERHVRRLQKVNALEIK